MSAIAEPIMSVDVRETAMHIGMSMDGPPPWIVNWSGIWVRGACGTGHRFDFRSGRDCGGSPSARAWRAHR